MLNLVLPIVSGLASLPVQDLSDPIGELIPEDAIAAIRIESINAFREAFTALDKVLAPGDPSSPDDPLRFILNQDIAMIRANLPIVVTLSGGAQGFIVPVDNHEAFATEVRGLIGQDAAVEHIGAYVGYMNGRCASPSKPVGSPAGSANSSRNSGTTSSWRTRASCG